MASYPRSPQYAPFAIPGPPKATAVAQVLPATSPIYLVGSAVLGFNEVPGDPAFLGLRQAEGFEAITAQPLLDFFAQVGVYDLEREQFYCQVPSGTLTFGPQQTETVTVQTTLGASETSVMMPHAELSVGAGVDFAGFSASINAKLGQSSTQSFTATQQRTETRSKTIGPFPVTTTRYEWQLIDRITLYRRSTQDGSRTLMSVVAEARLPTTVMHVPPVNAV